MKLSIKNEMFGLPHNFTNSNKKREKLMVYPSKVTNGNGQSPH